MDFTIYWWNWIWPLSKASRSKTFIPTCEETREKYPLLKFFPLCYYQSIVWLIARSLGNYQERISVSVFPPWLHVFVELRSVSDAFVNKFLVHRRVLRFHIAPTMIGRCQQVCYTVVASANRQESSASCRRSSHKCKIWEKHASSLVDSKNKLFA